MAGFRGIRVNPVDLSAGGTIFGDLIITGDLTVQGSSIVEVDSTVQGQLIIDTDNVEALLVRADGDGGDVLTVDTINSQVSLAQGSGTIPALIFGASGPDTGIYSSSNAGIFFTINSNPIVGITRSGVPVDRLQLAASTILTWLSGNAELGGPQFGLSREVTDGFSAPVGDLALVATNFLVYQQRASGTNYHRTGIKHRTETLSAVTGASVVTTIGVIPDGAIVLGVTTNISVALGTGNGTTGYQIGDGSDVDRWGDITGTSTATVSDDADRTNSAIEAFISGPSEVTITAVGGDFDGVGDIEIVVHYIEVGARK